MRCMTCVSMRRSVCHYTTPELSMSSFKFISISISIAFKFLLINYEGKKQHIHKLALSTNKNTSKTRNDSKRTFTVYVKVNLPIVFGFDDVFYCLHISVSCTPQQQVLKLLQVPHGSVFGVALSQEH